MSAAAAFTGSQALWFVSRASGLALLAAFSAAVVLGVAARLGSAPKRWSRLALGELHRALALFCVAFLGLHVVTAITDPYVTIGWMATVLPFASPYRTLAIGLGALAVDLGGAVLITGLVRRRLGYRAWRAVHCSGLPGLAGRVRRTRSRPATTCGSGGSRSSSGAARRRSRRPRSPAFCSGGGGPAVSRLTCLSAAVPQERTLL